LGCWVGGGGRGRAPGRAGVMTAGTSQYLRAPFISATSLASELVSELVDRWFDAGGRAQRFAPRRPPGLLRRMGVRSSSMGGAAAMESVLERSYELAWLARSPARRFRA